MGKPKGCNNEFPYRVITYYDKREEIETGHNRLYNAQEHIMNVIKYQPISKCRLIILKKRGEIIWEKSFGT